MKIIPVLYLSGGRCVSHYKGERQQATVLSANPFRAAQTFAQEGARILHIVDLDATDGGSAANREIAFRIARETDMEVEYADGVYSLADVDGLLAGGIARISLNQFSESLLSEAFKKHGPHRIIFTIQASRARVENRDADVVDYGVAIAEKGITHLIFRDAQSEGTFHPNFDEVDRLIIATKADVYAFGGVSTMHDLELLKKTGAAGVLISRAFFEGKLSLRECIMRFHG